MRRSVKLTRRSLPACPSGGRSHPKIPHIGSMSPRQRFSVQSGERKIWGWFQEFRFARSQLPRQPPDAACIYRLFPRQPLAWDLSELIMIDKQQHYAAGCQRVLERDLPHTPVSQVPGQLSHIGFDDRYPGTKFSGEPFGDLQRGAFAEIVDIGLKG